MIFGNINWLSEVVIYSQVGLQKNSSWYVSSTKKIGRVRDLLPIIARVSWMAITQHTPVLKLILFIPIGK